MSPLTSTSPGARGRPGAVLYYSNDTYYDNLPYTVSRTLGLCLFVELNPPKAEQAIVTVLLLRCVAVTSNVAAVTVEFDHVSPLK